jgi:PPOX class probable F420-dependent enzyme
MAMTPGAADLDVLKGLAAHGARAVLVTRRKDGGLQTSPMAVVADDDGTILTATPARSAKVYNLARDPRATLCVFTQQWPGPWIHIEGEAEIIRLPEAMPLLADYYARRDQDTSTDEFRQRMTSQNRVLIRVSPQRVVRAAIA